MRHADATATAIEIDVFVSHGDLTLVIADNGLGGADPKENGARGLNDRVEAMGGRLSMESRRGGTRLRADLPINSSAGVA